MKKIKYSALGFALVVLTSGHCFAQAEKNNLILGLVYYNDNNRMQYVKADTKAKIDGKFSPVSHIPVKFYISSETPEHLLGSAKTDENGRVTFFIPPGGKDEWSKSPKQSFIAVTDSSNMYAGVTTSIDLIKAKIKLDTAEDKKIIATFMEQKESGWSPVKGVDMKIAVKRLGGDLNVDENPVFTTDSLGAASADFKLVNLPGDTAGNLVLIAKVEDNDLYGNLTTEKTVAWGTATKYVSDYNKRSLFARAHRPPFWLLWMASCITLTVWFVMFYLLFQILKLKILGA